jgi:hypothetical protein
MRLLKLFLTISFIFLLGSIGAVSAQDWEVGENRIPNPDFEIDAAGGNPSGWTLEDGT